MNKNKEKRTCLASQIIILITIMIAIALIAVISSVWLQKEPNKQNLRIENDSSQTETEQTKANKWVKEQVAQMTLEEKIWQLFWVPFNESSISAKAGGTIFFATDFKNKTAAAVQEMTGKNTRRSKDTDTFGSRRRRRNSKSTERTQVAERRVVCGGAKFTSRRELAGAGEMGHGGKKSVAQKSGSECKFCASGRCKHKWKRLYLQKDDGKRSGGNGGIRGHSD